MRLQEIKVMQFIHGQVFFIAEWSEYAILFLLEGFHLTKYAELSPVLYEKPRLFKILFSQLDFCTLNHFYVNRRSLWHQISNKVMEK